MSKMADDIDRERHIKFFRGLLQVVPGFAVSLDTSRIMIVYFSCAALDLMDALDAIPDKQAIIDWVYHNQVVLGPQNGPIAGGFIGGGFAGPMGGPDEVHAYHQAHVSMTYTALAVLAMLGDDFSRVDREAIIAGLRGLQQEDGSFQAVACGTENDMRFVFSAVAISFMLQDWRGIDVGKTVSFIRSSQSFDGGFGVLPGQEAHAGAIYCAVAALSLLGHLDEVADRDALERFLVSRMVGGVNGRINKPPDTCYTFWVGGALQALGLQHLLEADSTRAFVLSCQSPVGGFAKVPGAFPDVLHAYFSLCGLGLLGEPGVRQVVAALGLSERAFADSPFGRAEGGPKTATGKPFVLSSRVQ